MDKDHFLSLVKNYTALSTKEAFELSTLQTDFPYSQVIHNLAARAAQDNDLDSKKHLLQVSAIYTTDRTVLKSIMTATKADRKNHASEETLEEDIALSQKEEAKVKVPKKEVKKDNGADDNLSGEALRKDLLDEIEKLKVAKHAFEVTMEAYEKGHFFEAKPTAKKATKKALDSPDNLIEEIKTTKKKVIAEGKQKEQIEIIENFIKTKPSIAKNKAPIEPAADDLAEKSLMYGDNIVSETLVEILLKQGKKEKAIEVLKKLIWKFPQKKTYFAARIEDLKN